MSLANPLEAMMKIACIISTYTMHWV